MAALPFRRLLSKHSLSVLLLYLAPLVARDLGCFFRGRLLVGLALLLKEQEWGVDDTALDGRISTSRPDLGLR